MKFEVTLNDVADVILQNAVHINIEQENSTRYKKHRQTRGKTVQKIK